MQLNSKKWNYILHNSFKETNVIVAPRTIFQWLKKYEMMSSCYCPLKNYHSVIFNTNFKKENKLIHMFYIIPLKLCHCSQWWLWGFVLVLWSRKLSFGKWNFKPYTCFNWVLFLWYSNNIINIVFQHPVALMYHFIHSLPILMQLVYNYSFI
jgi:hypothetical protein